MYIIVGKMDFKQVGINKAIVEYGCLFLSESSPGYGIAKETLKKRLPKYFEYYGKRDFKLGLPELNKFEAGLKDYLKPFLEEKEEKTLGMPDTRMVMGKNIHIFLRNPKDKIISSAANLLSLTENCIKHNKNLYFSIED